MQKGLSSCRVLFQFTSLILYPVTDITGDLLARGLRLGGRGVLGGSRGVLGGSGSVLGGSRGVLGGSRSVLGSGLVGLGLGVDGGTLVLKKKRNDESD